MSVLASLKSIDIQRYSVMRLLDVMEIDIDDVDGHLYFAEDPSKSIDINDKVLRLDVGTPNPNIRYTTYNPLTREDHAQFLMTLSIYSQIHADLLSMEDAKEADFHLNSTPMIAEVDTEFNGISEISVIRTDIVDALNDSKGSASHVDPAMSIVLAVVDYLKNIGYLNEVKKVELTEDLINAFNEYTRLSELKPSQRRNEMKSRDAMLRPPEQIDNSPIFCEVEEPKEEFYEDDPDDDVDFDDSDFEESDGESFFESDFASDEFVNTYMAQMVPKSSEFNDSEDDQFIPRFSDQEVDNTETSAPPEYVDQMQHLGYFNQGYEFNPVMQNPNMFFSMRPPVLPTFNPTFQQQNQFQNQQSFDQTADLRFISGIAASKGFIFQEPNSGISLSQDDIGKNPIKR